MLEKAMIMAAGVGSRLGALSNVLPKPLVPVANIPTMDILLSHLSSFGIKDVIANTYYKAEYIQNHCKNNKFGINFNFIQEQELSGTAGGLKKCQFFLEDVDDFIVLSGDGLTDVDIEKTYLSHKKSNAIATIVTKEVEHSEVSKYGIIVTDETGTVKSFQEKPSIDEAKSNLANTGIYIFKREIFNYIPENTFYDFAKNVFIELMKNNEKINTYNHKGYWSDIGSIEQYKQSNRDILENKIAQTELQINETTHGKYIAGEKSIIAKSVKLIGNNVIGSNCNIAENSIIQNSVLWDNIKVESGVKITNSIVLSNAIINKDVDNEIVEAEENAVLV